MADSSWWDFLIDPEGRKNPNAARITDSEGRPAINPPDADGRTALDYPTYLGLDSLLSAQTPASRVPEERMFIIIHQLFELVFKQMVFDFGVVARTFETLLNDSDEVLQHRITEPLPDENGPDPFWRPAMTAAARLRHSARRVLPSVMSYVGYGDNDDVLFSTYEYLLFRDFLAPASGFQAAALRLIQRALGKSPMLELRVFPGDSYGMNYSGCPVGHVPLSDPLVLQKGYQTAFPEKDHPAEIVTRLDDLAHELIARIGRIQDTVTDIPPIRLITEADVERVVTRFQTTLGDKPDSRQAVDTFRTDLEHVRKQENKRRGSLDEARRGALYLQTSLPESCLVFVLDRIISTDTALHASTPDAFLTVHRQAVKRHVTGDGGTGGGGMPYLVTSQRFLLPLFPTLVAYGDLAGPVADEDRDRW